jgi:hypothetical protein
MDWQINGKCHWATGEFSGLRWIVTECVTPGGPRFALTVRGDGGVRRAGWFSTLEAAQRFAEQEEV